MNRQITSIGTETVFYKFQQSPEPDAFTQKSYHLPF